MGSLLGGCDFVRPTETYDAFVRSITLTGVPAAQILYQGAAAVVDGYADSSTLSGIDLQTSETEVESFRLEVHYPQEGSVILSESFNGLDTFHTFIISPDRTLSRDNLLVIKIINESDWFGKEWFRGVW